MLETLNQKLHAFQKHHGLLFFFLKVERNKGLHSPQEKKHTKLHVLVITLFPVCILFHLHFIFCIFLLHVAVSCTTHSL